ncbi:amidohydrolase [Mycolicibacterium brisbanense]|uniref:Hydrolase n=1 Tax=Mycolicibacterium brisbanense TaxID=146020 RepID=A0A100W0N5_9MYCO|nr:amidohydrolase [Mycolicibacterium brisbanense]MCV7161835.1 amidohydrolase [Mycolicibacterium brisbanense]GAS89346.1 hydrolase [Mycolicibacterium brisbanense]
MTTHYRAGRIFTAAQPEWAQSLVVSGSELVFVGDTATADALPGITRTVELDGALVLPGFIDAHTHLVSLGQSLQQVDLFDAVDLADIQSRLTAAASADPSAPRILGRSWLYTPLAGRTPDRHMLDAAVADRPVYLASNDVHSAWVNTAALRELGIDAGTPDPIGGTIERDADGNATGMLYETAALGLMRTFLDSTVTNEERDAALAATFTHYLAAGVTGAVDMGLDGADLPALERALAAGNGTLPLRIAGHWLVNRTASTAENLAQVQEAIELNRRLSGPWLRIAGIKILVDGVIDSCTAAMKEPYADGSHPGPIWDLQALAPVVAAADAAGLQVAMHAIGDEASDIALSALEHTTEVNGPRDRRHRIEHLETVTEANVARLARLGVVASMQPVHADPAIADNWRAMLGDSRADRGFPWPEFSAAGATLAFGSDAPTAPYPPLPNMYVATTRRSPSDPSLAPNLPDYALPLAEALAHGTRDAAYSCRWEHVTGRLVTGYAADFVVLDRDPFAVGADALLTAQVRITVAAGHEHVA